MSSIIREIAKRFLEQATINIAEEVVREYGDHERTIISVGVHFQACCLISDEYTLEDETTPRYVLLEGLRRQEAISKQNNICSTLGLEPLRNLADIFDRKTRRFLEVGITKRESDEYYQEKFSKIGNDMDIHVFTYEGKYFSNNPSGLEDIQKTRIFTFLSFVSDELRKENMFTEMYVTEERAPELEMYKSKLFIAMRDESVPLPYINYEHLRTRCETFKRNKAECEAKVADVASRLKIKLEHLEENKLRPLKIPEEKEAPYTHKFMMKDAWFFAKPHDSERAQPQQILYDFFEAANMGFMTTSPKPIFGKQGLMYHSLWGQIKRAIKDKRNELEPSEQRDFLCGVGRASKKIQEDKWQESKEEEFKQEETKGAAKRGFPTWFNEEWLWAMRDSGDGDNKIGNWIPMAEMPPCKNEMEDYAKKMCEELESKIQGTNCAREMSKLIHTIGSLHTECRNFPGKVKIVPIYCRGTLRGESTDCLFGIAVKGKSHLNKDDGMYTVVTFEFSTEETNPSKHEKYTVFEAGTVPVEAVVLTPKREKVIKEKKLFLYCRTTGMSKLKNDWFSKCRRCLIPTMETVEQIVLKECALREENRVSEMLENKRAWIAHENGEDLTRLVSTKLKDLCRMLIVTQFYYCIYNDNQLEGFCNEQKKFLMFLQADKDSKSAFTFNQKGLYEKIEECIVSNPLCIFLADRLNKLFLVAKSNGAKYFE
nr:polymerase P3 [Influenza D virus]